MQTKNLRFNAGIVLLACSALTLFINFAFYAEFNKNIFYQQDLHNGFLITLSCMIAVAIGLYLVDRQHGSKKMATSLLLVSLPTILSAVGYSLALIPFTIWIGIAIGMQFLLEDHNNAEAKSLTYYVGRSIIALILVAVCGTSSYFILSTLAYCSNTIMSLMTENNLLCNLGIFFFSLIVSQVFLTIVEQLMSQMSSITIQNFEQNDDTQEFIDIN